MQDQNIDVNLVIQSFQERITQLTMEIVVKDATIKQLTSKLEETAQKEQEVPKKDK